jgi:glucosamine kinase
VSIFLGIDGGGSKTTCAIGDETRLLGRGTAGASNVVRVGEERAKEAIATALQAACDMAHVSPAQIERTCAGMAGSARPETAATARRLLAELVGGEIQIVGDMVIALKAAFGANPGVVVIAGTGSIVYGRNSAGETARAGGWGPAISDEGSGHWIGRAALTAAMRAHDQGQTTPLLGSIMAAWHVNTHEHLILAANSIPSPDFAGLLPTVLSAANAGDATASVVLTQAGIELAALATIVLNRLFAEASAPVAMSGGVFRNSSVVRKVFYNTLRTKFPDIAVMQEIVDPVDGALELARRGTQAAGW